MLSQNQPTYWSNLCTKCVWQVWNPLLKAHELSSSMFSHGLYVSRLWDEDWYFLLDSNSSRANEPWVSVRKKSDVIDSLIQWTVRIKQYNVTILQRDEQVISEFKDLTQGNIYIFRYIFLYRNPFVCWMKRKIQKMTQNLITCNSFTSSLFNKAKE